MTAPDAITPDKLGKLIVKPRCPVLLDVRGESSRAGDPRLVPGARPLAEAEALPAALCCALAASLPAPAVVICRRGPSPPGCARKASRPKTWKAGRRPGPRPKIDRIACPWLIRRFIDQRAVFLCVAPPEVTVVAELMGAMPYDIEGVFWSHRDDLCTFDAMLAEFGLSIPALDRIATIVRVADTARTGVSEAGMALSDAVCRWTCDATGETHNGPKNRPGGAA